MAKDKKAGTKGAAPNTGIGILHRGSNADPDHNTHITDLKHALAAYAPVYDDHYANDDLNNLVTHAKQLAASPANKVLVASGGTHSMQALINARALYGSPTTPIVFTSVTNPPAVTPYLTGVNALTSDLDPDRLDIAFELIGRPIGPVTIGVLVDSKRIVIPNVATALNNEAAALNVQYGAQIQLSYVSVAYSATIGADIAAAFTTLYNQHVQAVVVAADPLFYDNRASVIAGGSARNIPTIYQWRKFVEDGGLISYGTNLTDAYQKAGAYINLILKDMDANGGHPTNTLPIFTPTAELVVNTTTAHTQGIVVPQSILDRAIKIP